MSSIGRLSWLVALIATSCPLYAAETPEWWEIETEVVERLLAEPIVEVAAHLAGQEDTRDARGWLTRLAVEVRAGHREAAGQAIDRLAGVDSLPDAHELSQVGDFLIDRQEWDLARRFLERFPTAQPGWGYVFVKSWAKHADAEAIDRWLARQAQANERYWFAERLRFRKILGTEDELLHALAAEVRKHPDRIEPAERYLSALDQVGGDVEPSWMGEVCRPGSAWESYRLGELLARRSPQTAVPLLERSLAIEVTVEDRETIDRQMRMRSSILLGDRDWERELRSWTKHTLARCYQETGRADRAQPLIEDLSRSGAHSLPPPGLDQLAGQVQGASGARVIENRIREAETDEGETSEYWLTRAAYFSGRKENEEAVRAFRRALELAPLDDARPDPSAAMRRHVLGRYLRHVGKQSGVEAAVGLLRAELEATPVDGPYATHLVHLLLELDSDGAPFIDPADDLLWAWLDSRVRWERTEERLLWTMLRRADGSPAPWKRAETLATHGDPSRSGRLGWIMTRTNESARAVPFLQDAVRRLPSGSEAESARFTLLEAYLDIDDWESAEAIWPEARQHLGPREIPEWLGRIAVAAARSGAADDAIRLWGDVVNVDRGDLRYLDDLVRHGLSDRLRAFYVTLAGADPDCWVPGVALERLP